jgi:hypothetical protein
MNDIYDWIMFFLFAICIIITGVSVYKWTDWKRESNENLSLYLNTKLALDKTNEELKTYKDMERVIKIEKVVVQPRELECKFMLHERFVDDTESFKKIIVSETARYIAEEIERDPYLCKVFHSVNSFDCTENIMVHFRLLPYAEGVAWDDIFKEETR